MSGTVAIKGAAKTYCISVTASSSTAVAIDLTGPTEVSNFVSLLNTGAVPMNVVLSQNGDPAVLPVAGTPAHGYMLPANMTQWLVVSSPTISNCQITAIATGAGPSLLYVKPLSYIQ